MVTFPVVLEHQSIITLFQFCRSLAIAPMLRWACPAAN